MKSLHKKYIHFFFALILVSTAYSVHATDYTVLAPLPGIGDTTGKTTLQEYLPRAFNLAIGISAVLAFVMITFGGIMYAVSDSLTGRQEGKKYVTNAIYGLVIAIGAYTIIYTINPQMLNFKLDVQRPLSQSTTATPPVTGTQPTGGVGCQGICPYWYVNSQKDIVSYKDCFNCSTYSSFGLDVKTTYINGKTASINNVLGNKLKAVQGMSGTPNFQLTETWPPTVNHKNQLQYTGQSVDLSLAVKSADNIKTFIQNANAQGLNATYEVATDAQRNAYISQGVPAGNIITVSYITGEHFSIK